MTLKGSNFSLIFGLSIEKYYKYMVREAVKSLEKSNKTV